MILLSVPLVESALAGASTTIPGSQSPARCALELEALDETGAIRLQTTALALPRPGELLVNLSRLRAAFSRLTVSPDPELTGSAGEGPRFEVTELIETDPAADLALLRAPGVGPCGRIGGAPAGEERFIGLRDRDGYRSRLFEATLVRSIDFPGEGELMLLRIEDGAGSGGGFLFDGEGRLAGGILRSGSDTDPSFGCARKIAAAFGSERDAETPARPPSSLASGSWPATPIALFARALLLSRPDQTDRAIELLNEAGALIGEFPDLLLERGARRFAIGRTAPAIDDFTKATRLAPDRYLAHYNLGMALGASGRFDAAAREFERAHKIDPRQPRALYQLALAHEAAFRPDLARLDYERLAERDLDLASELGRLLGY